ncbi:MAG: hypothetical protein K0R75_2586 [Paenibacillaceae bacterium]|jgi:hypothetical protein|nr:hypothetical protein [Paenibacillaceae bacterium]
MKNIDGIGLFKWIMVIPVVLITYFIAMVIVRLPVQRMLIGPFVKNHREVASVLSHLYSDVFCVALAVMGGITLAPSKKIAVAVIFFIVILLTSFKYFAPIFHGNHTAAAYFLVAAHLAGGLLPLLVMAFNNWINRYAQRTNGLPEDGDEPIKDRPI